MIVGAPFWQYFLAVVPPEPAVAPLIAALRELEVRPYRIISHVDDQGKVFNASFFDSVEKMNEFLEWYGANALTPGSAFHSCLTNAAPKDGPLPTPGSLLFGKGVNVLADTRFGEYQLGMVVRFNRQVLRDQAMHAEASVAASTDFFEERIAARLQDEGIAYFGRLVMEQESEDGRHEFLTAARFGSEDDAHRGTAILREMLSSEIERWFSSSHTLIGTATRVLEL